MALAHRSKAFGGYKNTSLGRGTKPISPTSPGKVAPGQWSPENQVAWQNVAAKMLGPQAADGQAAPAATPSIQPFLRPEDLQSVGEFDFSQAQTEAGVADQERQAQTSHDYNVQLVNQAARKATSAANDSAASRGIFQSSIRDGDLADIEGQRSRSEGLYNDQLHNVQLNANAQRAALVERARQFTAAMQGQAKSNAEAVPPTPDESSGSPAASAPSPGSGSPAAPAPYKVVTKGGKKYHVYNGGASAGDWKYVGTASDALYTPTDESNRRAPYGI